MKTEPMSAEMHRYEAMEAFRKVKAIADLMLLAGAQPGDLMLMDETLASLGAVLNDIANSQLKAYDAPTGKRSKLQAVAA